MMIHKGKKGASKISKNHLQGLQMSPNYMEVIHETSTSLKDHYFYYNVCTNCLNINFIQ